MSFPHEDADFDDLVQIVAGKRDLTPALVEKDYWVTHALWALHAQGFEVWFKGGTSLSKAFGLIERFSEDLDLKVEPGTVSALAPVKSWTSSGTTATRDRERYFGELAATISIPGTKVELDPEVDRSWRGANVRVLYPGRHLAELGVMLPFVKLEIGVARVTPFVRCDLTSFVHQELESQHQLASFTDNRPRAVWCVHPLVTLLEKLDALHRHWPRLEREPANFVRHYEDAARIIRAAELPSLTDYEDVRALAAEMVAQKQLAQRLDATDPAFEPDQGARWESIRAAHTAVGSMFWGERIPLEDACTNIRAWISGTFG